MSKSRQEFKFISPVNDAYIGEVFGITFVDFKDQVNQAEPAIAH